MLSAPYATLPRVPRVRFHIGDVARKLREAQEWTVVAYADRIGLNKATVSHFENDPRGAMEQTIERIAGGFGLSADELRDLVPDRTIRDTKPPHPQLESGSDVTSAARTPDLRLEAVLAEVRSAAARLAGIAERYRQDRGQTRDTAPPDAGGRVRRRIADR